MQKKIPFSLIATLVASLVFSFNTFGQISPFSKVINDLSLDGIQTYASCQNNLGSTILVGEDLTGNGLIIMIDKNGNLQWNKKWKVLNSNSCPIFTSIISTNDNTYFLSGSYYLNQENQSVFAKLNIDGDTLWTKTNSISMVYSSIQTSDNGFIMLGRKAVASPVYNQISILKVNSNGDQEWSKSFTVNNKPCHAYSIKQKSDGNYLMVGKYQEESSNRDKGFLSELNETGDPIWAKTFFDEINNRSTDAHDFQIINDSIYLLLSGWNSIIAKTDLSGNLAWAKEINGTYGNNSMFYSTRKLRKTDNNHLLFISGSDFSTYSTVDLNANILLTGWLEINATDIFSTEDDGILVVGNGPIWGVKNDFWRYNIGLIQMDEAGYGVECVESGTSSSSLIELATNTIVFQEQSGGQPQSTEFEMGSLDLNIEDGCVDFTGSIGETSKITSSIFPNPNNGFFTISLNDKINGTIEIVNNLGQTIVQKEIHEFQFNLNLEKQPTGVYFYQIESENQIISSGKIIIQD